MGMKWKCTEWKYGGGKKQPIQAMRKRTHKTEHTHTTATTIQQQQNKTNKQKNKETDRQTRQDKERTISNMASRSPECAKFHLAMRMGFFMEGGGGSAAAGADIASLVDFNRSSAARWPCSVGCGERIWDTTITKPIDYWNVGRGPFLSTTNQHRQKQKTQIFHTHKHSHSKVSTDERERGICNPPKKLSFCIEKSKQKKTNSIENNYNTCSVFEQSERFVDINWSRFAFQNQACQPEHPIRIPLCVCVVFVWCFECCMISQYLSVRLKQNLLKILENWAKIAECSVCAKIHRLLFPLYWNVLHCSEKQTNSILDRQRECSISAPEDNLVRTLPPHLRCQYTTKTQQTKKKTSMLNFSELANIRHKQA